MMVNSAQPGVGGWCTPSPFTLSTTTSKVVVYTPAERAVTLLLFLLYPFLLCGMDKYYKESAIFLTGFRDPSNRQTEDPSNHIACVFLCK
jgi:hypothetical protein